MSKKGRRNLYYNKIKPNLELIKEWISEGMEIKYICSELGIPSSSWYKYINKFPELYTAVNGNRGIVIPELTREQITNITFTLTVLIQEDPYDIDECDELVMVLRKYENEYRRLTVM